MSKKETVEKNESKHGISFEDFKTEVIADYKLANLSRNISVIGRREVLTGKAKFGIFGDGKEIVQIALAKQFKDGDWRSGYYRDQTWMMAAGLFSAEEFFHQLYGNTDGELNPGNGGRSFNNHFSTANINPDGSWKVLTKQKNSSADISPTAGQMPRLLGLAYASKLFRQNKDLKSYTDLSIKEYYRFHSHYQYGMMVMEFQSHANTRPQKAVFLRSLRVLKGIKIIPG
jgi:TPP-dependent pyruvate/acetoin dehydrogenase alpha subunit